MTLKNTRSPIRALSASLVLIGLLTACSKEPAQAPAPTPVPPSVANGAAGAQGSAPAAPSTQATAPAPADNNTVAGVQFPPPNAKTSEHPLYVQPKEPVLQTDGSLRAAFEGNFR